MKEEYLLFARCKKNIAGIFILTQRMNCRGVKNVLRIFRRDHFLSTLVACFVKNRECSDEIG